MPLDRILIWFFIISLPLRWQRSGQVVGCPLLCGDNTKWRRLLKTMSVLSSFNIHQVQQQQHIQPKVATKDTPTQSRNRVESFRNMPQWQTATKVAAKTKGAGERETGRMMAAIKPQNNVTTKHRTYTIETERIPIKPIWRREVKADGDTKLKWLCSFGAIVIVVAFVFPNIGHKDV